MDRHERGFSVGVAALVLVAVSVSAQDRPLDHQTTEVWAAVSGVVTAPSGMFTSSYSPPLLLDGSFSSQGEQVVTFSGNHRIGFNGGINYFVTPVGIQLLADWMSVRLGGANQPYEYSLLYNSQLPPNGVLVPVKIAQTVPWPDSSGTLSSIALAFNGVIRLGRPDHINATLSGGPAVQRITGTIQPVAYTQFHLGGHSVLFQDNYELALSLEPTIVWGFDAGGDMNVPLGRHAAVVIGYRHFVTRHSDVDVAVSSVLNPDQIVFSQPLTDIATRLAPMPTRIDLSSSRLIIGIKLMR
jgi:hypothetical protein